MEQNSKIKLTKEEFENMYEITDEISQDIPFIPEGENITGESDEAKAPAKDDTTPEFLTQEEELQDTEFHKDEEELEDAT